MSIGNRIKKLRKEELQLTQAKFGQRIGLKPTAIGQMESGDGNVTTRTIILICKEFNVNEEWLRYGTGDMFVEPDTFSLDEYANSHNLTSLELSIMKSYMELDEDVRHKILSSLKSIFNKEKDTEIAASIEDDNDTSTSKSTYELEEEYKKIRSIDVVKQDATVLSSTEELKKMGNV